MCVRPQCERQGAAAWSEALALVNSWTASLLPRDNLFVDAAARLLQAAAGSGESGAVEASATRFWRDEADRISARRKPRSADPPTRDDAVSVDSDDGGAGDGGDVGIVPENGENAGRVLRENSEM